MPCLFFSGSDLLPKSLAFFNEPSVLEVKRNDPKRDSFSSTSKGIGRGSDKHTDQVCHTLMSACWVN